MRRISIKHIDEEITYDGSQIRPLWGFEKTHIQGDSIITFTGPMHVKITEMLDQKDIINESDKTDTPISSDLALHFIVEQFDTHSAKVAFLRQRLLTYIAFETIKNQIDDSSNLKRDFSDIYFKDKKLSVSIASVSPTCMKIHLGLNIVSSGAPSYVKTIGLEDLGISDYKKLAEDITSKYKEEIIRIEEDITKIKHL